MKLNEIFEIYKLNELGEMDVAGYGHYDTADKGVLALLSVPVLHENWHFITDVIIDDVVYQVYHSKIDPLHYITGFHSNPPLKSKSGTEKFKIIFNCELSDASTIIPNLHIPNLKNVDWVKVDTNFRGVGIAKFMYKFFVKKLNYVILGDTVQYFGARLLWKSLSLDTDVKVDIIDDETGQYVERNVVLHHGTEDWNFDSRVWSYSSNEKGNIRLILTDIIN